MSEEKSYASFVVTLWLEKGPEGESVWRGRVRHVQSGKAIPFTSLAEMQAVLERLGEAVLKQSRQATDAEG